MPAVLLPFEPFEYDLRLDRTRRAMQARGVELLIVSDPSNMAWLTGYDGWSFYVHQCVLLALDGDPVWFGRGQDANGARRTVFMEDEDICGYPDHYVQSAERHPMDYLSDAVITARRWDGLGGTEGLPYIGTFVAACPAREDWAPLADELFAALAAGGTAGRYAVSPLRRAGLLARLLCPSAPDLRAAVDRLWIVCRRRLLGLGPLALRKL